MKINDKRLYFWFALVMILVSAVFAAVACYSYCVVNPVIKNHLQAESDIPQHYREAYILLRSPHIFAGYDRFDGRSMGTRAILREFDRRVAEKEPFSEEHAIYLKMLFERRQQGTVLARNTAVYLLLVSLMGWGFYFHERKKPR